MMAPNIMIPVLAYDGRVVCGYMRTMLRLSAALAKRGIAHGFVYLDGMSLISHARDAAAALFLSNPRATHLLFMDTDEEVSADAVLAMFDLGKDLVGAMVPAKGLDWERMADAAAVGLPMAQNGIHYSHFEGSWGERVGDAVEVPAIGTGLMLISRRVFEQIRDATPELAYTDGDDDAKRPESGVVLPTQRHGFFNPMVEDGRYRSEDLAFCVRWTRLGGKCWVYLKADVHHTGTMTFRGDHRAVLANLESFQGKAGP